MLGNEFLECCHPIRERSLLSHIPKKVVSVPRNYQVLISLLGQFEDLVDWVLADEHREHRLPRVCMGRVRLLEWRTLCVMEVVGIVLRGFKLVHFNSI